MYNLCFSYQFWNWIKKAIMLRWYEPNLSIENLKSNILVQIPTISFRLFGEKKITHFKYGSNSKLHGVQLKHTHLHIGIPQVTKVHTKDMKKMFQHRRRLESSQIWSFRRGGRKLRGLSERRRTWPSHTTEHRVLAGQNHTNKSKIGTNFSMIFINHRS